MKHFKKLLEIKAIIKELGFTIKDFKNESIRNHITSKGKFEHESVATLYFYNAMMNGDGDYINEDIENGTFNNSIVFEATPEEMKLLDLERESIELVLLDNGSVIFQEI